MGICGALTTPYHPEANGTVERVNGTLVSILRKLASGRPGEWSTFLPSAIFAYNIAHHSATGRSPFMLLYGRQPALPPVLYSCVGGAGATNVNGYLQTLANTLIKLQSEAYLVSLSQKI